jgi:hypothetical protein
MNTGKDNLESSLDISSNETGLQVDDYDRNEGQYDAEKVMYAIVTGIGCTILLCIFIIPLAKKWDMFITKMLAGKTGFVVQDMDQDQSSHVSNIIMVGNNHSEVSESNVSWGEQEEEEEGGGEQKEDDDHEVSSKIDLFVKY